MTRYGYMSDTTSKTLCHIAHKLKRGIYDPHSVLSSAAVTRSICSDSNHPKLAGKLLRITDRAVNIYFAAMGCKALEKESVCGDSLDYYCLCKNMTERVLMLSAYLDCNDTLVRNLSLIRARIEDLYTASLPLRLSVLNARGKIFLALPELEYIHSCRALLSKNLLILNSYEDVNNMFTLCT